MKNRRNKGEKMKKKVVIITGIIAVFIMAIILPITINKKIEDKKNKYNNDKKMEVVVYDERGNVVYNLSGEETNNVVNNSIVYNNVINNRVVNNAI